MASDAKGEGPGAAVAGAVRAAGLGDRVKTVSGVLAAIATAVTGLWGVYEKSRSEAREDTKASYETIAPEINRLKEVVMQLQRENAEMRGVRTGTRRIASSPPQHARGGPAEARPAAGPPAAAPAPPAKTAAPPAAPAAAPQPVEESPGITIPEPVLRKIEEKLPVDWGKASERWKRIQKGE